MVSGACGGDDCGSGAGKAQTVLRRRAKCGVSDGGEGWSPPRANSSPAAASPGSSEVGLPQLTDGAYLT